MEPDYYDEENELLPHYHYDDQYDLEEYIQARVQYHDFKEECRNLVVNCMNTIFFQSLTQLKTLLLCSLALRIVARLSFFCDFGVYTKINFLHVVNLVLGMIALQSLNEESFVMIVFVMTLYATLTYTVFFLFTKEGFPCGKVVSIITAMYLIGGELVVNDPQLWQQIRGILMLLSLKAISFSFDLDTKRILKLPSFLSYIAYCMHCGTLLFGPWVSFEDYVTSLVTAKPLSFSWCYNTVKSLGFAILCLLLSSCVFSYLFIDGSEPDLPALTPFLANHWMLSYQSAVAFHFSHFYVCYLSQTTCILSGIGRKSTGGDDDSMWSEFTVTQPCKVEIPTSMLNVVVAWNIPMSRWLKRYVFNAYKQLGSRTAVVLTYAASAMLHGLSFHLAAVLLSLAFYTFVEFSVRRKLSKIFNCQFIQARPLESDSTVRKPLWAYIFNFVWVCINLMHLAYLGAIFQSRDDTVEVEGYPMKHTLEKWRNLGFFSHGFALVCFVLNLLIKA